MKKSVLLVAMALTWGMWSEASAEVWSCSPTGVSINPTFELDAYNGASFRKVVNVLKPDEPFVAIVDETASDTLTYNFPQPIQEEGYLGMIVKTLGIVSEECTSGRDAYLNYRDLTGEESLVPYCCS